MVTDAAKSGGMKLDLQFFAKKADDVPTFTKHNYRKHFLDKYPELPSNYQVHHTLPQKYESIMKVNGINIGTIR